jgi:hypothetical protein
MEHQDELSILSKRIRSQTTSAEEELDLKVKLMLNHPKYLPKAKLTPEQKGMLTN